MHVLMKHVIHATGIAKVPKAVIKTKNIHELQMYQKNVSKYQKNNVS